MEELARRGIAVPEQVSVTGFDDIGLSLDAQPPITTVRQPHTEIGEAAIDAVLRAVDGGLLDASPVTVPGTLVFRQSCGCSPSQAESYSLSSLSARIARARTAVTEDLEKTIEQSLDARNPEIFVDAFTAALAREDTYEPMFELWVARLKRMTASREPREAGDRAAERAWLLAAGLERLGRAAGIVERARGARTRNSLNVLNGFFSRTGFTFDAAGRSKALLETLPQLGIQEFMLCLSEATKGSSRVELVIPAGLESTPASGETGSARELVHRFLVSRAEQGRRGPLLIMRLHQDESDLGFFICSIGEVDGSLYLALGNQLSSEVKGSSLIEAVRNYSRELENKVATLSGFLPICAVCKKIRDDKGYWSQVEEYISLHSEVQFSHGICPDCVKKLYPELDPPDPKR